ncbi:zf-HC2 domain-containing protein [Salimicrobium jeotgali]|uniref:zf-HC2 domain-containing protein n=1 Tax=Salimicrobium jeotgali TaxID=1230341 RepID=UPI000C85F18C|nr:zf-HC2 domain-containing protein [Salimicrobium jeotgali]
MKTISCEVIQDLIPLYVEDMLSEDSKELVEIHLDECKECNEYLNELKTTEKKHFPIETDSRPLRKIQATLRKKKWQTIIFSTLLTLLVGVLAVSFLTAREYLPYSEEVVSVSETDNGSVLAVFDDEVAGYDLETYPDKSGTGSIYHLTAWETSWQDFTNNEGNAPIVLNPDGESVESVYYYHTDGSQDQLIYGEDQHSGGGVVTLPRLSLAYFSGLAMIALLFCVGLIFAVRSNETWVARITNVTFLPLSYLLAQLIVVGWNTTTYSVTRDFTAILLVAILLYGMLSIGSKWVKTRLIK